MVTLLHYRKKRIVIIAVSLFGNFEKAATGILLQGVKGNAVVLNVYKFVVVASSQVSCK